ncbi:hypothetical protein ACE7GA_03060 [Roseomonas sp. CCTCC AB2023176]|uniref:capsid assembly protein n=1 Tax=Roseomonas sp. CCTCC AB2023176 TaxID=3342640 RepID=UPI0035DAD3D4
MTENLLEPVSGDAGANARPEATPTGPVARPDSVPEKFWDAERGEVRLDALLKSYRELERRLSARFAPPGNDAPEEDRLRFRRALGVPEAPEGYAITCRHPLCDADGEVNARLHAAGFTPSQAQLVYDLAAERLVPLIAETAAHLETERGRDRLRSQFGGEERFARIARQIAAWGRANLAEEVFEALASTPDGVLALYRMMEKSEPGLARDAAPPEALDEAALRKMVRDPRYWRTREPEFIRRVTEGFRRLTGTA